MRVFKQRIDKYIKTNLPNYIYERKIKVKQDIVDAINDFMKEINPKKYVDYNINDYNWNSNHDEVTLNCSYNIKPISNNFSLGQEKNSTIRKDMYITFKLTECIKKSRNRKISNLVEESIIDDKRDTIIDEILSEKRNSFIDDLLNDNE